MKELNSALKELKEHAEKILAIVEELSGDKPASNKKAKEPEKEISLSDIKAVLMEKARAGLNDEAHELIRSYGVEKLSAIDPSLYGELMKKAEGLGNA